MNKIDGDDYAMPQMHGIDNTVIGGGMTIRVQLAAMICAGLSSNPNYTGDTDEKLNAIAVHRADLLIAELNKECK